MQNFKHQHYSVSDLVALLKSNFLESVCVELLGDGLYFELKAALGGRALTAADAVFKNITITQQQPSSSNIDIQLSLLVGLLANYSTELKMRPEQKYGAIEALIKRHLKSKAVRQLIYEHYFDRNGVDLSFVALVRNTTIQ